MTPAISPDQLAELEKRATSGEPIDGPLVTVPELRALLETAKQFHRLSTQLALIHSQKHLCGTDIMTPEKIAAWAAELGWSE